MCTDTHIVYLVANTQARLQTDVQFKKDTTIALRLMITPFSTVCYTKKIFIVHQNAERTYCNFPKCFH